MPVGGENFRIRPDRTWGPPSFLYNRYRVFLGAKQPGRGADHSHPSSAEVKGRVELYNYSSSGSSWPVVGWASLNILPPLPPPPSTNININMHVKLRFQAYSSHIAIPAICPAILFAADGLFYNPPAILVIACQAARFGYILLRCFTVFSSLQYSPLH